MSSFSSLPPKQVRSDRFAPLLLHGLFFCSEITPSTLEKGVEVCGQFTVNLRLPSGFGLSPIRCAKSLRSQGVAFTKLSEICTPSAMNRLMEV